ncbi:MAG: glycine dehydrogenase subunit 2 [Thermoplasmata archaeon]|nr:MAG: glycine dehydrogenase subunit 2 [Thermoplasmata archaeon]
MFRMAAHDEPLLNKLPGDKTTIVDCSINGVPFSLKREEAPCIPNLSEPQVIRHFLRLSQMNYGVDTGMYPLGSCTMKYNPKISEEISRWEEFANIHPYQHFSTVQGTLRMMFELEEMLCKITGMDAFTLQPAAGAHGEFLGMLLTRAYHEFNGETQRQEVILPDTAHGTNPASAHMAGFTVIEIPSNSEGMVDVDTLDKVLSDKTACFMLTNPNTLGIFESNILEIAERVHDAGALLYYDGANLNAVMGKARPGDMGFDIVHLNLHKTFGTPHGGGGPGSGPVGVKKKLERFLPIPRVEKQGKQFILNYDFPNSVGKIKQFYGNIDVCLKAYVYILLMGGNGLKEASEVAVLNSNYMKKKLVDTGLYELPYKELRKHEFVLSCEKLKEKKGVRALDVTKRLLDYGFHPPTVYFPLIVKEALMIEPTECETKEDLDRYVEALVAIAEEDAEVVKEAPHKTVVKRVDETAAARNQVLTWKES